MPHKMDVEIVLNASQNYNYYDYHDSCFFTNEASFLLGSLSISSRQGSGMTVVQKL